MLLLENGAKEILKKPTYHQKLYVSIFKYTHFLCLSITHTHTQNYTYSAQPLSFVILPLLKVLCV